MNFFWPGMPLETDGLVAMETKELLVLVGGGEGELGLGRGWKQAK